MKQGNNTSRNLFIVSAIVAAVLTRVLPHPWNFTPMVGITLFGAAKFSNRWVGFIVPLIAMILSDILVNFTVQREFSNGWAYFIGRTFAGVYIAFIAVACIGQLLRKYSRLQHILLASLVSSFTFYFISNSIDFIGNPVYEQTSSGYVKCLLAGIPFYPNSYGHYLGSFFFNQFIGDLLYTGILFGAYALVAQPRTAKA